MCLFFLLNNSMSNQDRLINSDTIFLLNAMSTKEIVLRRVQIAEKLTHIPSTSGSIRTRLKEMIRDIDHYLNQRAIQELLKK